MTSEYRFCCLCPSDHKEVFVKFTNTKGDIVRYACAFHAGCLQVLLEFFGDGFTMEKVHHD